MTDAPDLPSQAQLKRAARRRASWSGAYTGACFAFVPTFLFNLWLLVGEVVERPSQRGDVVDPFGLFTLIFLLVFSLVPGAVAAALGFALGFLLGPWLGPWLGRRLDAYNQAAAERASRGSCPQGEASGSESTPLRSLARIALVLLIIAALALLLWFGYFGWLDFAERRAR